MQDNTDICYLKVHVSSDVEFEFTLMRKELFKFFDGLDTDSTFIVIQGTGIRKSLITSFEESDAKGKSVYAARFRSTNAYTTLDELRQLEKLAKQKPLDPKTMGKPRVSWDPYDECK